MEERDIVQKFSDKSGIGLILTAAVSLLVVGILKGWYFYHIFEGFRSPAISVFLPISIAVASQLIRFTFLLSSAKDLGRGNMLGAALGGVASIGIIVYEISEATHWVAYWSEGRPEAAQPLFYAFCFLILSALFCEGRLCIALLPDKFTMRKAERELRELLDQKENVLFEQEKQLRQLATFKQEIEAERQQAEQEKEAEKQRKKAALEAEREKRIRELEKIVEGKKDAPRDSRAAIEEAVKKFWDEQKRYPTQEQIAERLNIVPKTIRNHFPNGTWKQIIETT